MILDGRAVSNRIKDQIRDEVNILKSNNKPAPRLAVILVGENPASVIYVKNKKTACDLVGFESVIKALPADCTQKKLERIINELNLDSSINGILLQLPLPKGLNERSAVDCISPDKDVDGLTTLSLGKLFTKEYGFTPCTPTGVLELLNEYNIDLYGKHVVIINRSVLVGRPLEQLLINKNATVTICHSHTEDVSRYTKKADIVISAVGKKDFIKANMIKKKAVVIDVAVVRQSNGVCGDVDFKKVYKKASYITPVPGGVGPMTIAILLKNTLKAYYAQQGY